MLRSTIFALCTLPVVACGLAPDDPSTLDPKDLASLKQAAVVPPGPTPGPPPQPTCYPFMYPDLVPEVYGFWPGTVYPLSAATKNVGMGPAGASRMRIEAFGYNGATFVGNVISTVEVNVPALSCGQGNAPTLPWAPPIHCGIYNKVVDHCIIRVTVDLLDAVDETKEANNVVMYTVTP